jgi:hypothetical protein
LQNRSCLPDPDHNHFGDKPADLKNFGAEVQALLWALPMNFVPMMATFTVFKRSPPYLNSLSAR